jgi:hypothetical protein
MLTLEMPPRYMYGRLALQLAPILVFIALASSSAGRNLLTRDAWVLPLALAAVRYGETGRLYPVSPAKAFYPPLDVLSPIDRQAPARFAAFGLTFIPNMSALYELEDVRAYEAMTLRRLAATFPLWCAPQPVWFNRVDDPTKPFLSFLNVRYFLAPPDYGVPAGWRVVRSSAAGNLLENERVLPRAFAPRRVFCAGGDGEQLEALRVIQDFGQDGVASLRGCAEPGWLSNGEADVQIAAYRADALEVAVDAQAPAVLATSIPGWPGWRVKIDGEPTRPIFYNYAFLGVEVPAGRHNVSFRYLPTGLVIGAAISGFALGVVILSLTISGRRRLPAAMT